jgi:hypothetical protein
MSFVFCDNIDQRRNSYNMENLSLLISDCTSPILRSELQCDFQKVIVLALNAVETTVLCGPFITEERPAATFQGRRCSQRPSAPLFKSEISTKLNHSEKDGK